ncbi:MAG: hypothetical protein ACO3A4_04965 [Silvanigrellaceae bacterium]
MLKIITVFVSGLIFVSCGKSDATHPEVDAQTASVSSEPNLVVKCRSTAESRHVSTLDSLELRVAGQSVSLFRIMVEKVGDSEQSRSQSIKGTINSVFDFNRMSQNSATLLLNPSKLSTQIGIKSTSEPLASVLIEYSQGRVKVSQRDGKVLFNNPNCRTQSANLTIVKGMTPSNN